MRQYRLANACRDLFVDRHLAALIYGYKKLHVRIARSFVGKASEQELRQLDEPRNELYLLLGRSSTVRHNNGSTVTNRNLVARIKRSTRCRLTWRMHLSILAFRRGSLTRSSFPQGDGSLTPIVPP